jgi:hypothetical protein
MGFDPKLVERVRREIGERPGLSEKPMFGCMAFFLNGNLACGVSQRELIVRVPAPSSTSAVKERGARPFDLSGRVMKGWVLVDPARIGGPRAFSNWISRGLEYASMLPRR